MEPLRQPSYAILSLWRGSFGALARHEVRAMVPIEGELSVRLATKDDLDAVVMLLRDCIADMRQAGIDQWDDIYPSDETLLTDIRAGTMHLGFQDRETLVGALVLNEFQSAEWSNAQWTITGVPILVAHRLMVKLIQNSRGKGLVATS